MLNERISDYNKVSVKCIIPQYATLKKHAIQFKSFYDQLSDKSVVPIEWIVDVQDEANGWFYATAYFYNDASGTLHIKVPDKNDPVYEGDVKIDYRLVHLVECVDGHSTALFNKIVRDSLVKVSWRLEWLDGELEGDDNDENRPSRWLMSRAICYVRYTNQVLVESPDYFDTGRHILLPADKGIRLLGWTRNGQNHEKHNGCQDFIRLIRDNIVQSAEDMDTSWTDTVSPLESSGGAVTKLSQARRTSTLHDMCPLRTYRTQTHHLHHLNALLTSVSDKSVVPIEWIVDVQDEANGWFYATAYFYNDASGTLHIKVPDKNDPVYEGDVKIDYRLVHLVECVDGHSTALFNKIVRDSLVKVSWRLEWLYRGTEDDRTEHWTASIAHYYIRYSNQILVAREPSPGNEETPHSQSRTAYVSLLADHRVRMIRCDDDKGLSDYERLVRDGSVLHAPRSLDFSHLVQKRMTQAEVGPASTDVIIYRRHHMLAVTPPCSPPPDVPTSNHPIVSLPPPEETESDLMMHVSIQHKASPPRPCPQGQPDKPHKPTPRQTPKETNLLSWLRDALTVDVDESYILHCYQCFSNDFIRSTESLGTIPPTDLTHDYLKSIGIDKVSVRWIIKRHHANMTCWQDRDALLAAVSDISSDEASSDEEDTCGSGNKVNVDVVSPATDVPSGDIADAAMPPKFSTFEPTGLVGRGPAVSSEMINMSSEGDERDLGDEKGFYRASVAHPDENIRLLKQQLQTRNIKPLEFIPLQDIKREINILTQAANNDMPYDEDRLDFLIACMEINSEYIAEREHERKVWREQLESYTAECIKEMRSFVPANVHHITAAELQEHGMSKQLANRILTKKCLWLVRMDPAYIARLHEVDLLGTYSPSCQQLDIVEMTAIYGSLPDKFANDGNGRKRDWKRRLEDEVRRLVASKGSNTLSPSLARFAGYTAFGATGPFQDMSSLFSLDVTSSQGAFAPITDFREHSASTERSVGTVTFSPRRLSSFTPTEISGAAGGGRLLVSSSHSGKEAWAAAQVISAVNEDDSRRSANDVLKAQLENIFCQKLKK